MRPRRTSSYVRDPDDDDGAMVVAVIGAAGVVFLLGILAGIQIALRYLA